MTDLLTKYDHWLADDGPAALVIRENLMPVEGRDGVLFPATFAAGENFPGGYNIDGPLDGENICLVDTVGSQANRIEPLFATGEYAKLVPQIVVAAGETSVNVLLAGIARATLSFVARSFRKSCGRLSRRYNGAMLRRSPRSPRRHWCSACGTRAIRRPSCPAWSPPPSARFACEN